MMLNCSSFHLELFNWDVPIFFLNRNPLKQQVSLGETPATQDASSQLSLITMDSAISACGTVGLWSQAAQLLSATLFTGWHNENIYTNAIRAARAPKHL